MEEKNIVEQSIEQSISSPVVENTKLEEVVEEDRSSMDSTLGKFKDAKSLAEAYKNLQSEFTKKCQRLSELEKKDNTLDNVPEYQKEHWKEKLSAFMENNQEAKRYSAQIGALLLKDKVLASQPNSLELAWNQIMKTNFVDKSLVGQDPEFYEKYIRDNQEIKDKIIKEYLERVQQHDVPPLIKSNKLSGYQVEQQPKPTTLKEARDVVARMFK